MHTDNFQSVSAATHRSFSAFQTMKNHNDTVSVPEAPTIKDSNQAKPDVIESAPTAEETISKPSEYEVMRTNSSRSTPRATVTNISAQKMITTSIIRPLA